MAAQNLRCRSEPFFFAAQKVLFFFVLNQLATFCGCTAASNLIGNPEDRFALDTSCMIIRYRCDAPLQIFTFVEDYLNSLRLELEKMLYWGLVKVIHLRRVLPDIVMFRFVVSMSNLVHEVEAMHCTS